MIFLNLSFDVINYSVNERWAGRVARMGDREEVHTGFWWEYPRERDHVEDLGVDGRYGLV